MDSGALAYAKAHVTAGKALIKHFRLAIRSPHASIALWGPRLDGFFAIHSCTKKKRRYPKVFPLFRVESGARTARSADRSECNEQEPGLKSPHLLRFFCIEANPLGFIG